jgi:hypothetical protein
MIQSDRNLKKHRVKGEQMRTRLLLLITLCLLLLQFGCDKRPARPDPPERGEGIFLEMHYVGGNTETSQINEDDNPCIAYAHYPTLIGPMESTATFNQWVAGLSQKSAAIALDCLANPEDYEHYWIDEIIRTWKYQQWTHTELSMSSRGIYSGRLFTVGHPPGAATCSNVNHATFTYDAVQGRFLTAEDVFVAPVQRILDAGVASAASEQTGYTSTNNTTWFWALSEEGLRLYATVLTMDPARNYATLPWYQVTDLIRWSGVMGDIFPEMRGD